MDRIDHPAPGPALFTVTDLPPPPATPPLPQPGWVQGIRLRAWQREALARFEASTERDFLAVATPGAGKTTFALGGLQRALVARRVRRAVIVVPTQHLKIQWAKAAERFRIHLDPDWSSSSGALPSDVHGVVVTYQQVAANPLALRPLVREALAILDEIHHAGESRSWGDGVRTAFEHATRRLCLSGTPFRSDLHTIPFVRYKNDLAEPDLEYGYGQALEDRRVVRPVYFPRINGHMEWTASDGQDYAATFDDRLGRELGSQRLRAALDADGEWLPGVLRQAHNQLLHLRARDPHAAGLVIAIDQDHARAIAAIMTDDLGLSPTIATSDDPEASRKIANFADGLSPWIVAVRMVSEGVDIPRLRVGVYATNTVTELFFRQAVGRLVRWVGGTGRQMAYMFIPDDPRLRAFAHAIAEQRRHSLRRPEPETDAAPSSDARPAENPEDALEPEQLSLFQVISSVALDDKGRPLQTEQVIAEDESEVIPDMVGGPDVAVFEPLFLEDPESEPPLPEPDSIALSTEQSGPKATNPLERRRILREQNSEIVRELVHFMGKGHAEVNADLNKKLQIKRVTEASVRQLEQRLELARTWLKKR